MNIGYQPSLLIDGEPQIVAWMSPSEAHSLQTVATKAATAAPLSAGEIEGLHVLSTKLKEALRETGPGRLRP